MNKFIFSLLVLLMVGVQSCNKVDTGEMLEGDYWVKKHYRKTNGGAYTLYKSYNVSSPVYYFLKSTRASISKINMVQALQSDTLAYDNISLNLGSGGTELSYSKDSVIISGLERVGKLTYVVVDLKNKTGDSILAERKL